MPEYNDVDLRSFYDDPDSDLIEFSNDLARQVKDVIGCEDDEPEEDAGNVSTSAFSRELDEAAGLLVPLSGTTE